MVGGVHGHHGHGRQLHHQQDAAATGRHWPPYAYYMPAKGCPRCWVGGATIGWSVVDVEMQWGGMTEGGILGGI